MSRGSAARRRLEAARLYLVTDIAPRLPELLEAALGAGVDVVQLRDRRAGDDELLEAARVFRAAADRHGALFLLNDRPDLAVQAGADGVHVGQDDAPVGAVRAEHGDELLIGLSTHAPEQLEAGLETGADYLSVGPVWETPTKEGRPAAGFEYVRFAAAHAGERPWFAIGGIDADNVREVIAAGARRIVVVRAIRDAGDPAEATSRLRSALEEARPLGTTS